jgi:UDP-N-acetylmuramate dehydrogenase
MNFENRSIEIQENICLSPYTSWLVGGNADFFCLPKTMEELQESVAWAKQKKIPITVLSGGSNVLVSDKGIGGLTICLRQFSGTTVEEKQNRLVIKALAGTSKSELLKIFLKYKLAPALFLAGIPGDVGGGVVMNAGVSESFKPREFVEIVDRFWVIDINDPKTVRKYEHDEIQWSYRHSKGWRPGLITCVEISWPLDEDPSILEKVRNANKIRLSKQPLEFPSCGSVFKNPENFKAAELIDLCGLKGFSIGGAQVSEKHANFIVNINSASACDIDSVIKYVQKTVLEKYKVSLVTEVIYLGDWK